MQILPTVLVATVAITQAIPFGSRPRRSEAVAVTAVTDGDTITVTKYGHVRLLGIKAPELGGGSTTSAPFAQEARDRLSELVLRRWVRLEHDGGMFDEHRRQPAYVFREDGAFINAALLRDGLARMTGRAALTRLDELTRAEAEARSFHRGMWGSAPHIPRPGYTREPTQP
jgi:micrococcal nuclease